MPCDFKLTEDEVISVFSELVNCPRCEPGKPKCPICITAHAMFERNTQEMNRAEKEVWAPLAKANLGPLTASIWSAENPSGFAKLCSYVLAIGIVVGRRQMFSEMTEGFAKGKGASA